MNHPVNISTNNLVSGAIFNDCMPIVQLGVQGPPGTRFYINGGDNPAIIGFSGLFDIDLSQQGSIQSLTFDAKSIDYIKNNDSAILIIDVAYWGND